MPTINLRDEASVNAWKAKVMDLNVKAKELVDHATQVLKDLSEMAKGNFFNKVVEYADQVIVGVTKIMEGMGEILNVVNTLVDKAKQMIEELAGGVGQVITAIIG